MFHFGFASGEVTSEWLEAFFSALTIVSVHAACSSAAFALADFSASTPLPPRSTMKPRTAASRITPEAPRRSGCSGRGWPEPAYFDVLVRGLGGTFAAWSTTARAAECRPGRP